MKRVTMWYDGNHAICENEECSSGNCPFADPICEQVQNIIDRLAAIEDILGDEYDLDELKEVVQAKREGRCGIPPVKMHQKLFRVFNGEIYEETVCGAMWEPLMPRPRWKVFAMGSGLAYYWDDVFGKTVFLSHEEAEAALKAREQDGNNK